MKKVYFYLPEYPDTPTGGIKYHKNIYEYFKKNNFDDTYLLGNNRFVKYVDRNKFLKVVFGIIYAVKVKRNSIILLSNTSFLHFFIPMLLNKFYKRHSYFMIVHHLVRSEKPEYFRIRFEEYFIRHSQYVIAVSKSTLNEMNKFKLIKNKDVKIVPPGLDDKNDNNIKVRNNKKQLLFIGTLEERKGIIYLIEALTYLKQADIKLNIIGSSFGSDKYSDDLKQKVDEYDLQDKISFRGRVTATELEEYYRNSSIFVFPSLWEGYGMVVAEAMSHSLPVIAFKIPAMEELVINGINGYLVEPGNSQVLSEKIDKLLNDSELLKNFSEAAYHKSKTFQSWETTCSEIYKLVNRI